MRNFILLLLFVAILNSCGNDVLPKPKPFLKLQYPEISYLKINSNCSYNFEASPIATVTFKDNCWATIVYPNLKATVYITYRAVDNNLDEILKETEKLTYEHAIKADAINLIPYENLEKRVFAKLSNVEGNVASNIQFMATDSLKHVLAGALYFYTKPNYDSIIPAIKYIEKDIIHLVETLEWK
tara:strand:+ start:3481 stop:4032 length:552 start_codon:yes stop_codon:yes gene_type:complete